MKFYANPYNTNARHLGFYFETYDEYVEKSEALRDSFGDIVEEFEIDVIDGTQEEVQIANAAKVNQGNLEEVIDLIDGPENNWPAVFYLLDNGYTSDLSVAISQADDLCIVEDTLLNAASELFDEMYGNNIPKPYIDYQSFADDMRSGGDMREFEFGGKTYTCTNANF